MRRGRPELSFYHFGRPMVGLLWVDIQFWRARARSEKTKNCSKTAIFLHPAATLARRLPAGRHAVHVRRRGPGQKIFRKIKNRRDNFKNDLAAGLLEKPGAGRASVH